MKVKWSSLIIVAALSLAGLSTSALSAQNPGDEQLMRVRETVWRAWFANDTRALAELVPADTVVISSGEEKWKNQADIFRLAAEFQAGGGKLIRLEFPRTQIQHFGDVAILWSSYIVETEENGKRTVSSGRASEVFVLRNGQWTNPGWHTDNFK
jgi:ketosteroid isomerase-like protein